MLSNNFILQEAVSEVFNPAPVIADFKKALNSCNLTKYRSQDACALFYSSFFMNNMQTEMTFPQWCQVYNGLLNDDKFMTQLCLYVAIYRPNQYTGMFQHLSNLIDVEINEMQANRLRYLSEAKAFFNFMQMKFDSINTTIKAQTVDINAYKFIQMIQMVLNGKIFYISKLIDRVVDASYDKDDIVHEYHDTSLTEDAKDLIDTIEHGEEWINECIQKMPDEEVSDIMNEAILNKAKEAAKVAHVKRQKAERAFDEFIMKKYKAYVNKRRNMKHAEMVGEALRINRELKRILYTLPLSLFNPAWTVIAWVISVVVDRKTDKKDRDILIGQLKDEIEIVEEKISMAERNGDDKGKIELIRIRQKLTREYERIQRLPFDRARMQRNNT